MKMIKQPTIPPMPKRPTFDARDTQYNLPIGKDLISRAQAIDALKQQADTMSEWSNRYAEQRKGILTAVNIVEDLPPAQPDIIRCRNCKFASGDSRICMQFGHSPIGELDFCAWAERRTDEMQ